MYQVVDRGQGDTPSQGSISTLALRYVTNTRRSEEVFKDTTVKIFEVDANK